MKEIVNVAGLNPSSYQQEGAAINERFVGECLKKIRAAPDAEEGLRSLLQFPGESLECEWVYVFAEKDLAAPLCGGKGPAPLLLRGKMGCWGRTTRPGRKWRRPGWTPLS